MATVATAVNGPEAALLTLATELREHVNALAGDIGERNLTCIHALHSAASYIHAAWTAQGHTVERQRYLVAGQPVENLVLEVAGTDRPHEIVVMGAHYDSAIGSPGADDNASGVAALLALSRDLATTAMSCTLRLVAFVNEEPPCFGTDRMGSLVYARRCKERSEHIGAMVCLESIGYFSKERGSQAYPFPLGLLHPDTGSFIAVVGNLASRALVKRLATCMRSEGLPRCEACALPAWVPGVALSDHASFWRMGYRAAMVTDTAPFRNPHYHRESDTPLTLDYLSLAHTVRGLSHAMKTLAGLPPSRSG